MLLQHIYNSIVQCIFLWSAEHCKIGCQPYRDISVASGLQGSYFFEVFVDGIENEMKLLMAGRWSVGSVLNCWPFDKVYFVIFHFQPRVFINLQTMIDIKWKYWIGWICNRLVSCDEWTLRMWRLLKVVLNMMKLLIEDALDVPTMCFLSYTYQCLLASTVLALK